MANACLISVGNELLCGRTVDTNAAWIGGRLFAMGVPVVAIRLVSDDSDAIIRALREACQSAEIVLVTGGLGPTDDDLTRQALADYLHVPLAFHPDLAAHIETFFTRRDVPMPQRNRVQAYIPQGAESIDNPRGTAPGVLFESDSTLIALMPGVPGEMKAMFDASVMPRIAQRRGGPIVRSVNLRCFGVGESVLADMLGDRMRRGRNPLVNCTVSEGIITLQVVATADTEEAAESLLLTERGELEALLGTWVFGAGEQTLQEVVGQSLCQKAKTLAVAESCTGGLVAKMLTDVPGSSAFFVCGWVTYSNQAKIEQLGVSQTIIEQFGAVSEPVAAALAEGAAQESGADYAIGITGVAGPGGGTEQKPVGLVYIGLWGQGVCRVERFHFSNAGRQAVRRRAAQTALNLLRGELTV